MMVQFIAKEQDWEKEQTRYWFQLVGRCEYHKVDFYQEEFGIVESPVGVFVIDADGAVIADGDGIADGVRRHAIVTDGMRKA